MIRGLLNEGRDICFYNSILQILASTRPLLIHLESISTNPTQLPLHYHLHSLLRHLSTPNLTDKYEEPEKLLDELARLNPSFRIRKQEDAHEFLATLLQGLAVENETTIKLFEGILQNIIECSHCCGRSINEEPTYYLSLPLEKSLKENEDDRRCRRKKHRTGKHEVVRQQEQSLDSCLQSFIKPESIEQYFCDNCQSYNSARKQISILKFPSPILCIYLQRFYSDDFGLSNEKINDHVSFTEFWLDHQYSLYSIIAHCSASPVTGHYVAYVRRADNNWYKISDSVYEQVKLNSVLACAQAYLLFYERC
jgi:ubiquitin C-terminal hydrolase